MLLAFLISTMIMLERYIISFKTFISLDYSSPSHEKTTSTIYR